jgi:hypothetical protein
VRSPFHCVGCAAHTWEVYAIQNAGCLKCGAAHECKNHLRDSKCPLIETEEGGLCCSITGYCLPTLRLSNQEYVDNVYFMPHNTSCPITPIVVDEIQSIVQWFVLGKQSFKCKREDINKTIGRYQNALIKNFKTQKLSQRTSAHRRPPCIVSIIAQTVHQVKPKHITKGTRDLCNFCSEHIYKCLKNLKLTNIQNKKVNLVVGMLFLMKQGLVIQNIQWLPRVSKLQHCLPHETSLEKTFKLCMKLVCETENEIKLALRQRVRLT